MKKGLRFFALLAALCVLMSGFSAMAEGGYFTARNLVANLAGMEIDLTGLDIVGKAGMNADGSVTARLEADVNGESVIGANVLSDMQNVYVTIDGMQTGLTAAMEDAITATSEGMEMSIDPTQLTAVAEAIVADEAVQSAAMAVVMPFMMLETQDKGNESVEMVYGTYDCAVTETEFTAEQVDSVLNGLFDLVSACMNVEGVKDMFAGMEFDVEELRSEVMDSIGGMISVTLDAYTAENGMMKYVLNGNAMGETLCSASFTMDANEVESTGIVELVAGETKFSGKLVFDGALFADEANTTLTLYSNDEAVLLVNKFPSTFSMENEEVEGNTVSVSLSVEGSTMTVDINTALLEDGRTYKYMEMNIPDVATITADVYKQDNVAEVALYANAMDTEMSLSGEFEAGASDEELAVSIDGIEMIDAASMTEEQSDAFLEELSNVAMSALFAMASIPGVAAMMG